MRKRWALVLWSFLFLTVLAGCLPGTGKVSQKPRAVDGVLDLSAWNFERDGTVGLDGEWEFYWGQLLEPTDFMPGKKTDSANLIDLPRSWNGYLVQDRKLSGNGYATFRLRIRGRDFDTPLALKVPIMCTAYKLWANGELLAENGRVESSRQGMVPQYRPQIVSLNSGQNNLELVVQVSNYMHRKGGIWESIRIGTEEQVRSQRDLRLAFQLLLFGSFLALGIHYLGLSIVRRQERYAIYFVQACFLMSLRLLLVGEIFLIQVFPDFSWEWELKLEYLTYYLSMLVLLLLLKALFPAEVSPTIQRVTAVLSLSYSALVLLTPAHIYTHTLTSYQLYTMFLVFYFIYVLAVASRRQREGARFMLVGGIIYCASIIYDVFFANFRTLVIGHLAPLGLFMFLLAQHLALMGRLAAAFFRLEDLSERLLTLDKMKDEFLATTSHELRTPLSGILGIAESVLDGVSGPLTDNQKRNVSLIVASSKRLSILVDDIMDFCRLKSKDIDLELTPVNIHQVVDLVIEVCRPLILGKSLELKNQVPKDIPMVQADENRLAQILYNLIGNAIKFTPSGSVAVSASQQNRLLEIVVADTGIGVSADRWEDIFQPFQQADDSISSQYGGTGLGLSVSKSLVELHGGTIWVESEPGLGSRFHFTLPTSAGELDLVRDQEPAPLPLLSPPVQPLTIETAVSQKDSPGHPLILAVDDDPINLQVLVNQLSLQGYRLVTATSGPQALSIIDRAPASFDLVILDVMMPMMSGYEVCRRLRQKFSLFELPVLMLTAKNRLDDITAGFEAGANDYIAKPFDKNELLARVHTLSTLKESVAHAMINHLLATIDDLTGLHNRRFFFQVAEQEVKRAKTYGFPLSLIMLDLDHFKEINDSYGHSGGDDVLRALAERCRTLLRDDDILVRYGGEEFVVLLTKDLPAAEQVAERLRQEIAAQGLVTRAGNEVFITASFGLSTLNKDILDLTGLLEKADQALYQAKQQGRNQVVALK